jgi:hypothetical protein
MSIIGQIQCRERGRHSGPHRYIGDTHQANCLANFTNRTSDCTCLAVPQCPQVLTIPVRPNDIDLIYCCLINGVRFNVPINAGMTQEAVASVCTASIYTRT